jgi:16S rRNA (guanine966-N2)-methyltransferase
LRIISGIFKGRTVSAPKSLPVRPTTDFAKTALFNMVNNSFDIEKLRVLDLFAGTGGISYEFLSRGAIHVTSVDENFNCIKFIKETLDKLNFKNARAIKYDAFKFIKGTEEAFDFIFADPPYDLKEAKEIPKLVMEQKILKDGGWFVFEHQASQDYSKCEGFVEKRHYGNVGFSIFKNAEVKEIINAEL